MAKKRRAEDSSPSPSADDSSSSGNRAAKRPKVRNLRGRRGSLQDLPQMPLDVLYMILSLLDPLDLLHLARTSRNFRNLLMGRSSTSFWKAARLNIERIPDCPPYLSEPAYANLVFDTHCHNCLKKGFSDVIWEFRARYCKTCKETQIAWRSGETNITPYVFIRAGRRSSNYYHVCEEEEAQAALSKIKGRGKKKYLEDLKAKYELIAEHSKILAKWYEAAKKARSKATESVKKARINSVLNKLRELGWGEELDSLTRERRAYFLKLPAVCANRPLTDRSWSSSKGTIIEAMEKLKAARIREGRVPILDTRLKILWTVRRNLAREFSDIKTFPRRRDFALLPDVRAIIDVPNDHEITEESFNPLRDTIRDSIAQWIAEKKAFVETLIRESVNLDPESDISPWNLAMSLGLRCSACHCSLSFPGFLIHKCQYMERDKSKPKDMYEGILDQLNVVESAIPPGFKHVIVDKNFMGDIIRLCGQDPERVTMAEMDKLPTRFTCIHCNGCDSVQIKHVTGGHPCYGYARWDPRNWRVLTQEDSANAIEAEERASANLEKLKVSGDHSEVQFQCVYCGDSFNSRSSHMAVLHRIWDYTVADYWEVPYVGRPRNSEVAYLSSDPSAPGVPKDAMESGEVKICQIRTDLKWKWE